MQRWEILEIVERNGILHEARLVRPLGQTGPADAAGHFPLAAGQEIRQVISAALFDGFEPLAQSVVALPDGTLQKHWTFRMQVPLPLTHSG